MPGSLIVNGDARGLDVRVFEGRLYSIIVADPPWKYNDRKLLRRDGGSTRFGFGAVNHYKVMSTAEIAAMPVKDLCAERAMLFLWATAPCLPDALRVMKAWGFKYSTVAWAWVKTNTDSWKDPALWTEVLRETGGMFPADTERLSKTIERAIFFGTGFYSAANIEYVLLGWRGRPFKHRKGVKYSQVLVWPLLGHSEKPEGVQNRIEGMYAEGPRLELFARRTRQGWDCFGNELMEGSANECEKAAGTLELVNGDRDIDNLSGDRSGVSQGTGFL